MVGLPVIYSERRLNPTATTGLTADMRTLTATTRTTTVAVNSLKSALLTLAGPLAALFAIGAVVNFTKETLAATDQIGKLNEATGISVETLQRWRLTAKLSGTELESFTKGSRTLAGSILDANRGLATQVDAFTDLGLSWLNLQRLSPEEQLYRVLDALSEVENRSVRTALAQDLLGRAGQNLLAVQGNQVGVARELGLALTTVLSDEQIQQAEDFNDAITVLVTNLKADFTQVLIDLLPQLERMAEQLVRLLETAVRIYNITQLGTSGGSGTAEDPTRGGSRLERAGTPERQLQEALLARTYGDAVAAILIEAAEGQGDVVSQAMLDAAESGGDIMAAALEAGSDSAASNISTELANRSVDIKEAISEAFSEGGEYAAGLIYDAIAGITVLGPHIQDPNLAGTFTESQLAQIASNRAVSGSNLGTGGTFDLLRRYITGDLTGDEGFAIFQNRLRPARVTSRPGGSGSGDSGPDLARINQQAGVDIIRFLNGQAFEEALANNNFALATEIANDITGGENFLTLVDSSLTQNQRTLEILQNTAAGNDLLNRVAEASEDIAEQREADAFNLTSAQFVRAFQREISEGNIGTPDGPEVGTAFGLINQYREFLTTEAREDPDLLGDAYLLRLIEIGDILSRLTGVAQGELDKLLQSGIDEQQSLRDLLDKQAAAHLQELKRQTALEEQIRDNTESNIARSIRLIQEAAAGTNLEGDVTAAIESAEQNTTARVLSLFAAFTGGQDLSGFDTGGANIPANIQGPARQQALFNAAFSEIFSDALTEPLGLLGAVAFNLAGGRFIEASEEARPDVAPEIVFETIPINITVRVPPVPLGDQIEFVEDVVRQAQFTRSVRV